MKDIEGHNRPLGAAIDREAYEFDPATSVAAIPIPGSSFQVYPNPAINMVSVDQINQVEIYSI